MAKPWPLLLLSLSLWMHLAIALPAQTANPLAKGFAVVQKDGGLESARLPLDLAEKLYLANDRGQTVRSLAFSPEGGWVLILNAGSSYLVESSLPASSSLTATLRQLTSQGANLRQVAFTADGGWVVLHDERGARAENIPPACLEKLQRISAQPQSQLHCVAFGPQQSWVLGYDNQSLGSDNLSAALQTQLKSLQDKVALRFVWFSQDHYLLLSEKVEATNLPDVFRQKAVQLFAIPTKEGELALHLEAAKTPPSGSAIFDKAGGTLKFGEALVTIPPNTLTRRQFTRLQSVFSGAPLLDNQRLVSQAYSFSLSEHQFQGSVTVTLPYDRSKLPPGATPYPVTTTRGALERLKAERIDTDKQTVTFRLSASSARLYLQMAQGRGYFLALAADKSPLIPIVKTPDCTVWGIAANRAQFKDVAPKVVSALAHTRARYAALGFAQPGPIEVYLVLGRRDKPLGQAMGDHAMNLPGTWSDDTASILAHEYFHLVQTNSYRGFAIDPEVLGDSDWLDEASAEFMQSKLYPDSTLLKNRVRGLRGDFLQKNLFSYDLPVKDVIVGVHQYESFIFLAYLDTLYDVTGLLRQLYPPRTTAAKTSLLSTLESFLEQTPDRQGRRRQFDVVYLDFLIHFGWLKDFAPLKQYYDPTQLGRSGILPAHPADPVKLDGQSSRTLHIEGKKLSLFSQLDITSGASGQPLDLSIDLLADLRTRLVIFPFTADRQAQAPLVAQVGAPVILKNWDKVAGASLWLVQTDDTDPGHVSVTLSVRHR